MSTPHQPRMKRCTKGAAALLLICGGCLVPPRPVFAQEALVLGGGGARGLAHAGVVVGLEQLGRDPEIVVGASMGAIVGALYGAGYEPEAIWRVIRNENWAALFAPMPMLLGPEHAVRRPLLHAGLDGLRPGRGLIPDWRINRRLVQLLLDAQARSRGDFDRLPRRFRAAATDLETGEFVAIGRGDLARAVRASMAVPGVFAPVAWDGRLLVDGGINNYLPIQVARTLGAAEVVAVDVLRPPLRIESLSPLQVGIRGLRLLMLNTLPDAEPDVLIVPPIPASFSEALFLRDPGPLLEIGLDATLAGLAPGSAAAAPRPPRPPPARLGGLVIETTDSALRRLAELTFRDVAPGRYEPAALLAAVDRLYATGLFTGVWPAVQGDDEGAPTLRLHLVPSPLHGLAGAAGYDNDRGFRGWAVAHGRVAAGDPVELRLAASADGLERWGSLSGRFHSIRTPGLVWTLGADVIETRVRLFDDGDLLDARLDVTRLGGWLGAEWTRLSPDLAVIAMLRAERIETDAGAGDEGSAIGPLLRLLEIDAIDRVVGLPGRVEAEIRFGSAGYGRARASGSAHGRLGRARAAALVDLALVSDDAPADILPALGDERLVPGLRWDREPGRVRAVAGADVAYPIPGEAFARLRLRGGATADAPDRLDDDGQWIGGAEIGILWSTAFGSLSLGAGTSTRGDWRFDIDIGPRF